MSSNLASGDAYQRGRTLEINHADVPLTKRTRSPTGAFSQHPVSASDAHNRALDSLSPRSTISTEVAEDKKSVDFHAVTKIKLPVASLYLLKIFKRICILLNRLRVQRLKCQSKEFGPL